MKKILSAVLAVFALTLTCVSAAQNPTVTIDGSQVTFADQQPIIKDDRTLVPARGVFEAMGAKVTWHEKERRVQIDSRDNFTRVYLTIDSDNMEIYKFKDIFSSDREDKTLDVAAQIINDRTMIPLRAVSDAFGCDVQWDGDARAVTITTKEGATEFGEGNENPYVYLSTEATDVSKGDEFDVYVNMKNFNNKLVLKNCIVAIDYNSNEFKFVSSDICIDDEGALPIKSGNPNFKENILVAGFAIGNSNALAKDGAYIKITLKALNDNGGEFCLSSLYDTKRGFMTRIGFYDAEAGYNMTYTPLNMAVDTTPIVIK